MHSGPSSPRGSTRVVGVIGDPVSHSRSPAIHNAAFAALGLDFVYVALPVAAGRGRDAVAAVRTLGLAGLNVTMPHKADVAATCDELSPAAAALGSVNTVVNHDGHVVGDSTDGPGLVAALRELGVDPAGRRVLVLGAGGAARAIVDALGRVGGGVTVAARRVEAGERAAALAPGAATVGFDDLDRAVVAADVVVNATPIGMQGEPPPFDPAILTDAQLVYDTVYHPSPTPLLAAAAARGIPCADGIGMLVHQAALAFVQWTGQAAPIEVMAAAAREGT
ncbi:MAG: shikimate dehydrogenase [Actinobacteria bacterium]|nr:shikimate dehydrogenase [Actinomycetota bacterium]